MVRQGKFADIDPTGIPRMIRQADDDYTFPAKIRLNDGTNEFAIEFNGTNAVLGTTSGDVTIDEIVKIGGGYGATGVTISAAGVIQGDGVATFAQDAAAVYNIQLDAIMKNDMRTPLAAAGDATNLGIVGGTHGSASPYLVSTAYNNTSGSETARFSFILPPEYDDGETVTVRVHAHVDTTPYAASATADIECFVPDGEKGISGELCTTVAQDINSATWADVDFTITPTTLTSGDELDIELTIAGDDGTGAANKSMEVGAVQILLDIKG